MLYPPNLSSTQSAFVPTSSYNINFTLPSFVAASDIGHLQVYIVKQTNNKSIANTSRYPDGIIYKDMVKINEDGSTYTVTITTSDLNNQGWQPGVVYKVQLRFGTNAKYSSVTSFATWKQTQINSNAFSEWSSVMVIKCIEAPTFEIKNKNVVSSNVVSTTRYESTTTPLFEGSWELDASINHESLDKYKFDIYLGDTIDPTALVDSSGWVQDEGDGKRKFRSKKVLTDGQEYYVNYSIRTVNGYEASLGSDSGYLFTVQITDLGELDGVTLTIQDSHSEKDDNLLHSPVYCADNGCINLYLSADEPLSGNYVISRTSEVSNFTEYQDIKYLFFTDKELSNTLVFQDFTIESGVKYRYGIQRENSEALRTTIKTEKVVQDHYVDFEYAYLYRDGVQLRLQFNQKMNSFKRTVLRAKQDTLGDKFPHLVENGYANYAEFPLNGLISLHMDEDSTFLKWGNDGLYFNDELVIPNFRFTEEGIRVVNNGVVDDGVSVSTNLDVDTIFIERKFREKVLEWLNSFDQKLYRSATEGNIVVGLMNVSLTPKSELGRMIFEFSATAYEIAEGDLDSLEENGIITVGEWEAMADNIYTDSFGQISAIHNNMANKNIYSLIADQEDVPMGEGYKFDLVNVTSLWVDQYPAETLEGERLILEKELADEKNKEEPDKDVIAELQAKIDELALLNEQLSSVAVAPIATTILRINNHDEIMVMPQKVYAVDGGITAIELISTNYPIVLNYTCVNHTIKDDNVKTEAAIDTSVIWGQISGVFTTTPSVLRTYDYNYLANMSQAFRVFNPNPTESLVIKVDGDKIVDDVNFNVYNNLDLLEIIKQEVKKQVEHDYNTTFYQDENGDWTDGTIYYQFGGLKEFDIEGDEGGVIYVDGDPVTLTNVPAAASSDFARRFVNDDIVIEENTRTDYNQYLRPGCRYVSDVGAASLTLDGSDGRPQYLVINYKCATRQVKMK